LISVNAQEVTMTARCSVSAPPIFAALALGVLLAEPTGAQYSGPSAAGRLDVPWENNRVRLTQLSVEPGATLPAGGNQVLVYLTADPDGKLPAEAVWQPAGAGAVQNRGRVRLEAIAIELKDVPQGAVSGTPVEAVDSNYGVDVSPLIDNARVLVTKHRYGPIAYGGPLHFHGQDVLVVYLRGGYTWPVTGFWGASRVRRGDVEVIPANTLHRLGNAGSDPLELLVIVPR
jgi:quercetin dioxygenase-like cupin family protein